jgi:hypothetical protein
MQFRGKLTESGLNDVRQVVRSKWYWLKFLAVNWYGIILLVTVIWGTIAGLVGTTNPNWLGLGILWVVIIAIAAWAFYSSKRSMAKEFSELSASLPDWITLAEDGIKLNGPNAATSFQPWGNFKGWREGKRVMLLDSQVGGFLMVPVAELSALERESLRQFLRLHIATVTARSAVAGK